MSEETVIGPDGKTWTRTPESVLVCEDGRKVYGLPEMTTEHLLSVAYQE